MKRNMLLGCFMASTLLLASTGCGQMEAPVEAEALVDTARATVVVNKPLPNFPLRYRGAGRFQQVGVPSSQLIAHYTFDMERGVNREQATYIDHEVEIFNVYDMDPSDGVDPDREYFVERDQQTGELHCTLNEFPLPNVFSRDWWLSNGMVYTGTETVSGFEADCWSGEIPGAGLPVKLCSRADKYPELSLLLKQVGPFEFSDHFGVALDDDSDPPRSYFKPPKICKPL